ncbi:ImmA/IrrE family metallo-endopeptidase [Mesorhizobium sp. M6A.T.Ce.TU.016.01.1.1]|uniref:ImmA/IrrE family metallo-endopeptidase n=1 Tax=Mesorhizobium sp. M6A.T.Ce.TU.016.01.1.1 TaxID=2496783 RepID=UPI000FD27ABA|nr:ImmA/IrrE family metallo-endopeptidase [Mesorhizobium sp. M6A.T.Ce.TU.016.01.1.1]RUU25548.1 ImmA/IrrE family metallo-endopeptidase [Mesorhizobium sp. M6A.T.Ce.TU.016.01.1.1]
MSDLSVETIEKRANFVREKLNMDNVFAFDMHCALERLQQNAKRFSFRCALDDELGDNEATMDDETGTLVARESVLNDIKAGRPRARFTIAHELGHYFLGHEGRRRRNPDKGVYVTFKERTEESEANIFASYFLIPTKLAWDANDPEEISDRFQVSLQAAEIAFERVQAAKRKASGEKRRPPRVVIDFLKEAQKKGYRVKSDISDIDQ